MNEQTTTDWMVTINEHFPPLEDIPPKVSFRNLCSWITRYIQRESLVDFMTVRAIREAYVKNNDNDWGLISTDGAYSRAKLIFVLSRWLTADMLASKPRNLDGATMFDFASTIVETINIAIEEAMLLAFQEGMPDIIEQQIIDGNLLEVLPLEPVASLFKHYSNRSIGAYLDRPEPVIAQVMAQLPELVAQHGGDGPADEPSEDEQFAEFMQKVQAMYAQGGAELVRQQLTVGGVPDEFITQLLTLLETDGDSTAE